MSGRHVRLREMLLGFEGLALLRGLVEGSDEDMDARVEEIRKIAAELDAEPYASGLDVREVDPRSGYAASSETYDHVDNPLIKAEQPVVEQVLATVPPGRALDAACGTGRHSKHLVQRHSVSGFDASPEMLRVARTSVPDGEFVVAEFEGLPYADGGFDVVVCALALCHLPELGPGVAELARVARSGATLVFTDPHPLSVAILSHLFVPTEDGGMGFVRNHKRLTGEYLEAFASCGLRVVRCIEPIGGEEVVGGLVARFVPGAMRQALVGLPCALVWELKKN